MYSVLSALRIESRAEIDSSSVVPMLLYQCMVREAVLGRLTTVNAVQVVQVWCKTKSLDSAIDLRLNMRGTVDSIVF